MSTANLAEILRPVAKAVRNPEAEAWMFNRIILSKFWVVPAMTRIASATNAAKDDTEIRPNKKRERSGFIATLRPADFGDPAIATPDKAVGF